MTDIGPEEIDEEIVAILSEGRARPRDIARRLASSRDYVSRRLDRLRERGVVVRSEPGLYVLVVDPRSKGGEPGGSAHGARTAGPTYGDDGYRPAGVGNAPLNGP